MYKETRRHFVIFRFAITSKRIKSKRKECWKFLRMPKFSTSAVRWGTKKKSAFEIFSTVISSLMSSLLLEKKISYLCNFVASFTMCQCHLKHHKFCNIFQPWIYVRFSFSHSQLLLQNVKNINEQKGKYDVDNIRT